MNPTVDVNPTVGVNPAAGIRRIALKLEYDGTRYAGWQRQANAPSVQQAVEKAIARLTGEAHTLTGASRTDAGVHALGQVAHFDTLSRIPPDKWAFALNTLLPDDVRVTASRLAPPDFHARFSAAGKLYLYHILNRPHAGALTRNTHAHVPLPLDVRRMDEAAQLLLGAHDFRACMAAGGSSKTFVRVMREAGVTQNGDELLFRIRGNGFLYNMVRILAGTLMEIGLGKREVDCFPLAFATGDRLALGPTAPAKGLVLAEVEYEGFAFS